MTMLEEIEMCQDDLIELLAKQLGIIGVLQEGQSQIVEDAQEAEECSDKLVEGINDANAVAEAAGVAVLMGYNKVRKKQEMYIVSNVLSE